MRSLHAPCPHRPHTLLTPSPISFFWIKASKPLLQSVGLPRSPCVEAPSQTLSKQHVSFLLSFQHNPQLHIYLYHHPIEVCLSHWTLSSASCRHCRGYHTPSYPWHLAQYLTTSLLLKGWNTQRWPNGLTFKLRVVLELRANAFPEYLLCARYSLGLWVFRIRQTCPWHCGALCLAVETDVHHEGLEMDALIWRWLVYSLRPGREAITMCPPCWVPSMCLPRLNYP